MKINIPIIIIIIFQWNTKRIHLNEKKKKSRVLNFNHCFNDFIIVYKLLYL